MDKELEQLEELEDKLEDKELEEQLILNTSEEYRMIN